MPSEWKQKVIKNFDAKAICYGQHNQLQKDIADRLFLDLPSLTGADILEIGCGVGTLSAKLFDHYSDSRFHITDICPKMLTEAQENNSLIAPADTQWSVMEGEEVNGKRQYDLIVSNMAFQWFETPEASLKKLQSLLKANGKLFYAVPSDHSFREWHSVLSKLSLSRSSLPALEWPGAYKEEEITIQYDNTFAFLKSLKDIGANVPAQSYNMLSFSELRAACRMADQTYNGRITWHIIFGYLEQV